MSNRHTPDMKREMAQALKKYRAKNNMTQEELARLVNTSVFSINRWERAKHYPTASAIKLMKILGILA